MGEVCVVDHEEGVNTEPSDSVSRPQLLFLNTT